jgi:hypothetical protein
VIRKLALAAVLGTSSVTSIVLVTVLLTCGKLTELLDSGEA